MACGFPQNRHGQVIACGQCTGCRIARGKEWALRMEFEAAMCESQGLDSSFGTLTFSPEMYPADGSLDPEHQRNFWKRVRKTLPYKITHFTAGEYGERSGRAHYHFVAFGIPRTHLMCAQWANGRRDGDGCGTCFGCRVFAAWRNPEGEPFGFVQVGPLMKGGAGYCTEYITKGVQEQAANDKRHPQFARMSRRPAIAFRWTNHLIKRLETVKGIDYFKEPERLPHSVRREKRLIKIPRALQRKIYEHFTGSRNTPEALKSLRHEQRQALVLDLTVTGYLLRQQNKAVNADRKAKFLRKLKSSTRRL